jgi:hypothetical protein
MTSSPDRHARTMLPIPDRRAPGLTTYDAKDPDTAFAPIEPLLPPVGAPNVLIVLLDDVGFGAASTFGGPCQTPTADRLAAGGLRYNRFHTTALCAPTRAALLSGRNHHSVGMGSITETATSAPGNSSLRPNTKAPLAMTLKLNGYSTAQFGKCHEVPVWQSSPMGPFDAWPSGGGGFETFYGFIGGENNQWDPALYDGTTPVEPPRTPEEGYHLTEDLADRAIGWVRQQKASSVSGPTRQPTVGSARRNDATRMCTLNTNTHAGKTTSTKGMNPTETRRITPVERPRTVSQRGASPRRAAMVVVEMANIAAIRIA